MAPSPSCARGQGDKCPGIACTPIRDSPANRISPSRWSMTDTGTANVGTRIIGNTPMAADLHYAPLPAPVIELVQQRMAQ